MSLSQIEVAAPRARHPVRLSGDAEASASAARSHWHRNQRINNLQRQLRTESRLAVIVAYLQFASHCSTHDRITKGASQAGVQPDRSPNRENQFRCSRHLAGAKAQAYHEFTIRMHRWIAPAL